MELGHEMYDLDTTPPTAGSQARHANERHYPLRPWELEARREWEERYLDKNIDERAASN